MSSTKVVLFPFAAKGSLPLAKFDEKKIGFFLALNINTGSFFLNLSLC